MSKRWSNQETMKDNYPKVYLYRRIVQAKLFIDRNYADPIDVDNIADEAHFSKFHFIRSFKEIYGKTPHQYLIAVRIEKAILLLKAGDPVSSACFAVGFESVSSFSGLFKRKTGLSPAEFSARQRELRLQLEKKPLAFIPGCFALQGPIEE